jgi:Protein of unknown function (DUF1360)
MIMSDFTGIFVNWVEPLTIFLHVIVFGIATGAISLFITKSTLLNGFHTWLEKKSPFLGEMLNCPWCTSHWVAGFFTIIYRPLLIDWGWRPAWMFTNPVVNFVLTPVDYAVTIFVMVAISAVTAGTMYRAIKPLME